VLLFEICLVFIVIHIFYETYFITVFLLTIGIPKKNKKSNFFNSKQLSKFLISVEQKCSAAAVGKAPKVH